MQKILMSLFLVALPSFLSAAPNDAQPCHLTVAWEEWYPLIYRGAEGKLVGSEYQIVPGSPKSLAARLISFPGHGVNR